jgi:hypothetical protein
MERLSKQSKTSVRTTSRYHTYWLVQFNWNQYFWLATMISQPNQFVQLAEFIFIFSQSP